MDLAFLFLYRKIEQTSAFSSKKYINWAAKNKTSDGRSIGLSIHDGPKKIQKGLWTSHPRSWVAHVKNESLDEAAQNHVQHLPKLRPSFSLFFAHSTLCGHFENNISFDCASYEDVLCMNVDQHDVNWLVVPVSTMNKTSNMMLTLFEKAVLI